MNSIYHAQVRQQGKEPSNVAAIKKQFPMTVGARTFQTEAEYREALHDFLNGQ
jgi:hypothetical protein